MDKSELIRLTDRQLTDILMQAENILSGRTDESAIGEFAKYSRELKSFLEEHTTEEMIQARLKQIPEITYKPVHIAPFMILVLPYSVYQWWFNYTQKLEVLHNIRIAKEIYSSIQFLTKSMNS